MSRPITLFCLLYGDPNAKPFEMEIDEEKTCSALKKLKKQERILTVSLSIRLKLWKWNNVAEIKFEK